MSTHLSIQLSWNYFVWDCPIFILFFNYIETSGSCKRWRSRLKCSVPNPSCSGSFWSLNVRNWLKATFIFIIENDVNLKQEPRTCNVSLSAEFLLVNAGPKRYPHGACWKPCLRSTTSHVLTWSWNPSKAFWLFWWRCSTCTNTTDPTVAANGSGSMLIKQRIRVEETCLWPPAAKLPQIGVLTKCLSFLPVCPVYSTGQICSCCIHE